MFCSFGNETYWWASVQAETGSSLRGFYELHWRTTKDVALSGLLITSLFH